MFLSWTINGVNFSARTMKYADLTGDANCEDDQFEFPQDLGSNIPYGLKG